MFNKKPKRNFRARQKESSDEDEAKRDEGENNDNQSIGTLSRHLRPTQSRGLSCSSRPEAVTSTADSDGDEDAQENQEADAEQKSFPDVVKKESEPQGKGLSFTAEKEVDGCEFKVKRSAEKAVVFTAKKKEKSYIKDVPAKVLKDEPANDLSEEEDTDKEEVLIENDDGTSSQTSGSFTTPVPSPGVIPSNRQIEEAKRKRRNARAQKDYIPLEGERENTTGTGDEAEEQEEEGQDENTDDELDDHERRIEFAPKPKSLRERIAEKIGGSDSESCSSLSEEEEEDRIMWEQQQIGKGVKRHTLLPCGDFSQATAKQKKTVIPDFLPHISIDIIKKRITGKLDSLREVHRAREAELRKMQLDMESSKVTLELLENRSSSEQLTFFKGMHLYIQNFVECLTEKMIPINSVEMEMHSLLIDQAEELFSRRREALHNESSHFDKLAYSTKPSAQNEETQQRSPCDLEMENENIPPDFKLLPEVQMQLEKKKAEILQRSQEIFADVQDEFWDVRKVLGKFTEWRALYSESYNNAYISLCIPKLLGPLIRHQLIGWNPLKADSDDFEASPWYPAVELFCHGTGYEESENGDKETLPSVIQKTILTKVQGQVLSAKRIIYTQQMCTLCSFSGFVELVWDVLSSEQSQCLTDLCKRLHDDYQVFSDMQRKPVKAFVEAVADRLRSAVDEDVFIPLYPKKFVEDRSSPQCRFQNQQFWLAVKLLGNITLWEGILPDDLLKQLSLDKLLNRYIMLFLINTTPGRDSVHKCTKVAACFPDSWFKGMDSRSSIPQLQNFSKHLLETAHWLCKNASSASREAIADLLRLMGDIKALDSVTQITEKYHLQDVRDSLGLT